MGSFDSGFPARASANTPQLGAGIVTNPLHLPIAVINESLTYFKTSATVYTAIGNATPNGFVSALVSGTSTVNLLSLNGSGFLTHVFSPVGDAGGTSIATITMTVDGVAYSFSNTAGIVQPMRLMLGALSQGRPVIIQNTATVSDQLNGIGSYYDFGHGGKLGKNFYTYYGTIPTAYQIASYAMPRLRFEKSLVIDIKMSVTPATTAANSQYAVAGYTLD